MHEQARSPCGVRASSIRSCGGRLGTVGGGGPCPAKHDPQQIGEPAFAVRATEPQGISGTAPLPASIKQPTTNISARLYPRSTSGCLWEPLLAINDRRNNTRGTNENHLGPRAAGPTFQSTEKQQIPMKGAYLEIAHIDARIMDKLLKRTRRLGMTANQDEVIELIQEWKRAAARIDKQRKHDRHKGH
jgi:hypothetical protein